MTRRWRVLLVDDHPLIRSSVRRALEDQPEFVVVAECDDGVSALRAAEAARPDLVFLDLRIPGVDGTVVLEKLKRTFAETKVIVLSVSDDPSTIAHVLAKGADAYVVKSVRPTDIPSVARQVLEGTVYMRPRGGAAPSAEVAAGLSSREHAILECVASGMTNVEIARKLWVAPQTVKFHLSNVYKKLGVENRTQALHYAHRHGLIANGDGDEDD